MLCLQDLLLVSATINIILVLCLFRMWDQILLKSYAMIGLLVALVVFLAILARKMYELI